MGQHLNRNKNNEKRVEYDEDGDNGLTLCGTYIPEELIAGILLSYVDYKSLINCQGVCKRWKILIYDYIWRKKSESIVGQSLQSIKDMSWRVNYLICHKKPFNRNLLKNICGKNGLNNWDIIGQGGDDWKIEVPPVGVSELPKEAIIDNGQASCFVTSYITCEKRQVVDLIAEGLSPELLDTFQPSIHFQEWYSCRWDCPAIYKCSVSLFNVKDELLDTYEFQDVMMDEKQNIWLHTQHEFKNYGLGLRKIVFQHSGKDKRFWAGHYGSKMTGASIIVRVPQEINSLSPDDDDDDDDVI